MTQLPTPPKSDRVWLPFLISALVALVLGIVVVNATPARGGETDLPREGVVSLLYIEGAWTVTLESADASEVKLVTPHPQEIACSEEQGQPKNGHPLCDKLSYTFESQAECITVQVDWTGNVHNSTDPPACKETSWPPVTEHPTFQPTTSVPTDEPVSFETPTPEPSVQPSVTPKPVTSPPSTDSSPNLSNPTPASTDSTSSTITETGMDSSRAAPVLAATGSYESMWLFIVGTLGIMAGLVLLVFILNRRRE